MDIVKAQRLSQNLAMVSDMVAYSDISAYLVESGVVDPEENRGLLGRLAGEGNVMVMNELLTMVTLRRGGFDALLNSLRRSDYVWLAEQLDPGKRFSGGDSVTGTPGGSGRARPIQKSIMTSITRRISRRRMSTLSTSSRPRSRASYGNEEESDFDNMFMSYRDNCPIDIPINPSHYKSLEQINLPLEKAPETISMSASIPGIKDDALEMLNLADNPAIPSTSSSTIPTTPSRQAVIYNLASTQLDPGHVEEYLTNLAKRANIPSPMLQDLKVLHPSGKISKKKDKHKNKLKIQFNSETGRNAFVQQVNQFIQNVKPNDDLYESASHLKVTIPKKKMGRRLIFGGGGGNSNRGGDGAESINWYQKPFRFQRKKK